MRKKYNFAKLLKTLQTEKDQISFLQQYDILKSETFCTSCNKVIGDIKKHSTKKYYFLA